MNTAAIESLTLAHLASRGNNGSAVLMPNAMMEALQEEVGHAQ